MALPYYNEGVGQGGFVAVFSTAGNVVLESFNRSKPSSHIINQPDEIGAPLKWLGVAGFETVSLLAQLPVTAGVPTTIALGEQFTAPATHGGGTYVICDVGEAYQVGDYWKANLTGQLRYN